MHTVAGLCVEDAEDIRIGINGWTGQVKHEQINGNSECMSQYELLKDMATVNACYNMNFYRNGCW